MAGNFAGGQSERQLNVNNLGYANHGAMSIVCLKRDIGAALA